MEIHLLTSMKKRLILPLLVVLPLTAAAESLYVSDTLRVGIRSEPTNHVPSLTVLKSGAQIELLEKKGSYAKVRTESGIEGWVKSAYLSKQKPYQVQWDEAQKQIKVLESQIKALEKTKSGSNSTGQEELQKTVSDLAKDNKALMEQVQSLKSKTVVLNNNKNSENNKITLDLKDSSSNFIYVALGAIAVILILGFLFGVSWHKKQVTKRLGGLSI